MQTALEASINRQIAFYLMALAPLFAIASKIDIHNIAGMLLAVGAMVASLGSSLNTPPSSLPPK